MIRSSVCETISRCDAEAWDTVVRQAGADIFMSRAFAAAVEEAFAGEAQFWHVVLYEDDVPVACGSLCAFPVDLGALASPATRRFTTALGRLVPRLVRPTILFCGLPVSLAAKHLAVVPGIRHDQVLGVLHELLISVARREGAAYAVFKEFTDQDCTTMDFLTRLGYRRMPSPAMNLLDRRFPDFPAYYAALRSRHRQSVRRSVQKARAAGLRDCRLTDAGSILQLYTPELHRLYEAVALSSDTRLEILPLAFFQRLVTHLPGRVGLTLLYEGERIRAFNWNLQNGKAYHFLFAGLDYEANPRLDLYFNLMYAEMAHAFRGGAEVLYIGQTADSFKLRLGCLQQPLFFYVAPVGLGPGLILRFFWRGLFPERAAPPAYHVFNDMPADQSIAARAETAPDGGEA
jgi:predicted N-acyltransferase